MAGVRLTKKSAQRMAAVVRAYEHEIRGGTPDSRGRWGGGWGPPKLFAKSPAGGIPACTGSGPYTLGSATCVIYTRSGATVSATSRSETVYNSSSTAVGANKLIQICWIEGAWIVDVESC